MASTDARLTGTCNGAKHALSMRNGSHGAGRFHPAETMPAKPKPPEQRLVRMFVLMPPTLRARVAAIQADGESEAGAVRRAIAAGVDVIAASNAIARLEGRT